MLDALILILKHEFIMTQRILCRVHELHENARRDWNEIVQYVLQVIGE